jgi:hypothetical protein
MEIFLDCSPCLLKQVLEASRMSTGDTEVQEKNHGGSHRHSF